MPEDLSSSSEDRTVRSIAKRTLQKIAAQKKHVLKFVEGAGIGMVPATLVDILRIDALMNPLQLTLGGLLIAGLAYAFDKDRSMDRPEFYTGFGLVFGLAALDNGTLPFQIAGLVALAGSAYMGVKVIRNNRQATL